MSRCLVLLTLLLCLFDLGFGAEPQSSLTHCPDVSQLQLHQRIWRAPGGWVSFYRSFATSIKAFTGAHWVGAAHSGQIICSYIGAQALTFPLQLQGPYIVMRPAGQHWGKEINGIINCLQNDPKRCPFAITKNNNTPLNTKTLLQIQKHIKPSTHQP